MWAFQRTESWTPTAANLTPCPTDSGGGLPSQPVATIPLVRRRLREFAALRVETQIEAVRRLLPNDAEIAAGIDVESKS